MKQFIVCTMILLLSFSAFAQQSKDQKPTMEHLYRKTLVDLRHIVNGIESFYAEKDKFPEKLEDLVPMHLMENWLKDPWGNTYLFKIVELKDNSFTIMSATGGSDGVFEGWDQRGEYFYQDCAGKDVIYEKKEWIIYGPKVKR